MTPVLSSNVAAIGHDKYSSVLYVQFHGSGYVYGYAGVSAAVSQAFLEAPSKGRFLAWFIKGRYPYARVA